MLHLLSILALSDELIERIGNGDDVLLQQSVIWTAMRGHADNHKITQLLSKACGVYVLREHLTVNGIADNQIFEEIKVIDYSGLVALTVKNAVIHTWC